MSRFNSQGAPAENLSPKFRTFLDARYEHHYSPEEILGYIYAVLYAPAYRARYAELYRLDSIVALAVIAGYSPEEQAVWINRSQFFKLVPQEVWDFHIGGYQALEKYLKSRKGRTLSLDEIDHVSAVADSLAFTIEQMVAIDAAYLAAFPDRG